MNNFDKKNIKFFNAEDFSILNRWAGKEYNSEKDTHQIARFDLKKGPWEKTQFWCKEVAKRTNLDYKATLTWHKQAGPGKLEFRPYAWARLFKKNANTKEIFFTVGIAVREQDYLHIKLDRQFESPKELTKRQLEIATSHLVDENNQYLYQEKILADDIDSYNWNKLIDFSVNFIEDHHKIYEDLLSTLNEQASHRKFTRVCWNTNGWTVPSGRKGKSNSPESFENLMGFGFEEWLFNENMNYNDYQYGFLQGINQDNPSEEILDLDLFAIERTGNASIPHWVASLKNVQILKKDEIKKIVNKLEVKKIFESTFKELNIDPEIEEKIQSYTDSDFLNIRFKLSDANFPTDKNKTEIDLDLNRFSRYKLYKGSLWDQLSSTYERDIQDEYDLGEVSFKRSKNRKSIVQRSAGSFEMHRKHDDISEKLEAYLNSIKEKGELITSESGRKDGRAIDMVYVKNNNEALLYEIKTYPHLRNTIREGLGQLLEYAFWDHPYDNYKLKLIIVGMDQADDVTIEYLKYLRNRFQLPIHYQQFDLKKGKLGTIV